LGCRTKRASPLFKGRGERADCTHSNKFFDGKIDEVRIEKTAPTLPYLAAEELNFANTYLTYGPEQFAGVN
jgi:hypothetical protein